MKSFLQTKKWLDFQEHIGHKVWLFDDGKIKANIIQHKIAFGKNYLYISHGPEIFFNNVSGGLKNDINNFIKYLKDLAKKNKSIFVKMEPLSDVAVELIFRNGIKMSKKHIQPLRTVIINLGLSEEDLLLRMHHKARYNIRLADKKELRLEESRDTNIFWELLQRTAKNDRFYTHTKDYYIKLLKFFRSGELETKLFFVLRNGKHIAGAIVMTYGDTVYYLHGAMDREYKEFMAPYFMHWEIIKKFKVLGFKSYDLWGIDARKWPGVTRFKLGWGGDVKEYPGSFDLVISKLWYFAYNLAGRIR
ncbi:MAG: peptidoglycan bridge formation glycyltransferase FemA/FemB family protein [Patescibacteria group bacterium]